MHRKAQADLEVQAEKFLVAQKMLGTAALEQHIQTYRVTLKVNVQVVNFQM